MYKISEIEKALNLLEKYDGQLTKTASELGINRRTLKSWSDKKRKGLPILKDRKKRSSKRTYYEEREAVIDFF